MVDGKVLYGILGTTAPVQALVGTKIYPLLAPQGISQPFIVFQTTQRTPSDTKKNVSRLDVYVLELSIVSNDYPNACAITAAVRTALDQYSGTVNAVKVDSIVYDSGTTFYDEQSYLFVINETYNMRVHL